MTTTISRLYDSDAERAVRRLEDAGVPMNLVWPDIHSAPCQLK